jgi:hypothetical protein
MDWPDLANDAQVLYAHVFVWHLLSSKHELVSSPINRDHVYLYSLEMRFLHVEVLERDLDDLVAARDECVEEAVDVVVVGVRVVRAAESAVLLAVGGREQQTLAT